MIRVLIIDDSAFIRKALTRILESDPSIKVIGTASDGKEGLQKLLSLRPDVVTLDIEMPQMNGLEVLRRIMQLRPTPVLMLSQYTSDGAELTLKALELGAMDFVDKSSRGYMDFFELSSEITTKIKAISRGKPLRLVNGRPRLKLTTRKRTIDVVGIGASTGGPQALQVFLPSLPEDISFSILIVQHMPEGFIGSLAARLNRLCSIRVKEAEDGEPLLPAVAYFCPSGVHMKVKRDPVTLKTYISLEPEPFNLLHRPSVDILFESIASVFGSRCIGVILSGMGMDGVEGAEKIKARGGTIIVQDEDSSVIFGMPRAAIDRGCADKVVHINELAETVLRLASE